MELIKMTGIEKSFSANKVLLGVDFTVNSGQLHALVGENGAGKSTLIKVLAGVHNADSGTVELAGKKVSFKSPKEAIAAGISTIHQELNLVNHLDVASNIFLGREPRNKLGLLDKAKAYAETEKLLKRVNAQFDPREVVANLGVAEKQMVEICKALSVHAKVVIMDEPTAVLSAKEIEKLFEVIADLKKDGLAIVYISHHLEELPRIAEEVSVLRDGIMIGKIPNQQISKDLLTSMMIGRDLTEQYPWVEKHIGDVVLEVKHLHSKTGVKNISFSVRAGEVLSLAGLVGAGRTETARLLVGQDKLTKGEIFLNGKPVKIKSPGHAKNLGIVMVPEERKEDGLVLNQSLELNISLPYLKKLSGSSLVSSKANKENSQKILDDLKVKPRDFTVEAQQLSGGNQQKVVIGKWIYVDHNLMIFDEPTRGVDVGAKAEIYKIVNTLTQKGVAVLMISSDLPEVIGMSDRCLVMRRGEISGELQRHQLSEQAIMQLAF